MKFTRDSEGQNVTKIKVAFLADRSRIEHAIAVQLDSGRKLHEITHRSTSTALEALFRANGEGEWIKPSDEAMTKATVKFEDLFPLA